MFNSAFTGRKVLITGHTGFKGSWLSIWLLQLGADVVGYAQRPETAPNHFESTGLERRMTSIIADILDYERLRDVLREHRPEVIFHLAAQPLVRRSYREPRLTFETNVLGTVNLFEAAREADFSGVLINVTSDKCYENKEWSWGYRETDGLGGHDPYSASKACSEIVTASYRLAFFNSGQSRIQVATARAGNVIGGGDWSEDRIIPDCVRAIVANEPIPIRNPKAIRPWQHVLEPLSGYLLLATRLMQGQDGVAEAWNFGPNRFDTVEVEKLVQHIVREWKGSYTVQRSQAHSEETDQLHLDCSKAFSKLKWQPVLTLQETLKWTIDWYRRYCDGKEAFELTTSQIESYFKKARQKGLNWVD